MNISTHDYYLDKLNLIARCSATVENSTTFSDFVAKAYDEECQPNSDVGHVGLLNMLLLDVTSIATKQEFEEMMKYYDLNKIFSSSLYESVELLHVVNGVLIDKREEI